MGRAHHTHLIASEAPREYTVWDPDLLDMGAKEVDTELTALCGETTRAKWDNHGGRPRFIQDASRVSCPKCNKKIAAAALKARPAGAPKLTAVQDKEAKGGFRYKQGWKVLLGDEAIGYVGYEEHAWRIYPLQIERYDDKAKAAGPYIRNTNGVLTRDGEVGSKHFGSWRLPNEALSFDSKEAAILGCEAQFNAGVLKTGPQLFADYARATEEARIRAREQTRKRDERQERKDETLAALREILEKETLSNFQRMGLMNAIADIEKKKIETWSLEDDEA
jgi:hypothetical protein